MTTTYTWAFPTVEVVPSEDGLTNVIRTVHWRLIATQDGYSAEAYGSLTLPKPEAQAFKEFSTITKADVEAWVAEQLNAGNETGQAIEQLKTALTEQIAKQKAPPVVTMAAPWE